MANTKAIPVPNNSWQIKLQWAVFALYAILVFVGVANHEPWRDEAQSWLVTRDNSFAELFRVLPSEGHPPLWYLLLTPFVKMGLPYAFQNWLAGTIAIAGVYLFIFKTKLPLVVKLMIPFSYYFLFEFSLFARSYCLIIFFIAAVVSLYEKRFEKPWLFAVCVVALFNTHILVFSFCVSLTGLYLWDAVQYKKINKNVIGAFVLMCLLGLYLYPYIGMAKTAGIFTPEVKDAWHEVALTMSFGLAVSEETTVGILLFLILCALLLTRTKPLLLLLGGATGLCYILGLKFISSIRHCGILFLFFIAAYGIAECYATDRWNKIKSNVLQVQYGYWMLAIIALIQLKPAFEKYSDDVNRVYSDSKNVAQFLLDNGLEDKVLAGHSAAYVCTILPYLPADKRMFYPEYPRYGSHYTNDSFYVAKVWDKPAEYYVNVTKEQFKDRLQDVVLIFNHPITEEVVKQVDVIYATPEPVIFPYEMFVVCKFKKEQ